MLGSISLAHPMMPPSRVKRRERPCAASVWHAAAERTPDLQCTSTSRSAGSWSATRSTLPACVESGEASSGGARAGASSPSHGAAPRPLRGAGGAGAVWALGAARRVRVAVPSGRAGGTAVHGLRGGGAAAGRRKAARRSAPRPWCARRGRTAPTPPPPSAAAPRARPPAQTAPRRRPDARPPACTRHRRRSLGSRRAA